MNRREASVRWAYVVAAVLVTAFFAWRNWVGLLENINSNGGDQGAFLLMGLDIRHGVALTDGNRQPLFPLMIAPFAGRVWSYFTWGKLISLAAGLGSLGFFLASGRRLASVLPALAAGLLLALNDEFTKQTPNVLCEALLVGLTWAVFYYATRALSEGGTRREALLTGLSLGLVYLTKGTGMLLLLGVLLALLLVRRTLWRKRTGLMILGVFVLVALPLWLYTWRAYGHPLYNFNSTHAFWFDNWDERYLPPEQWPTMATYLASHTLGQMVSRLLNGMWVLLPVTAEASQLGGLAWTGWLSLALPAYLVIRAVWLALRPQAAERERGALVILAGVAWVLFLLFFSWYAPVTDAPRFMLPLAPVTYLAVMADLTRPTTSVRAQGRARTRALAPAMVLVGGVLLGGRVALGLWGTPVRVNPFTSDLRGNVDAGRVVEWLNTHAAGQPVLWGPSHSLPKWLFLPGIVEVNIPADVTTWGELQRYVAEKQDPVVVLDKKMYQRRTEVLEERFDKDGETLLYRSAPTEADWRFAFAQKGDEYNWYVLQAGQPAPAYTLLKAPAQFGEGIRLLGYEARWSFIGEQPALELSLLWECLAPEPRRLTVSAQVLDAENGVQAQSDSYPLGGMFPTSFWYPGQRIEDRTTLLLPVGRSLSSARLVLGMYELGGAGRIAISGAEDLARFSGDKGIVLLGDLDYPADGG